MWLAIAMAILQTGLVFARQAFAAGSVPLQELVIYMHGLLFILGAGYGLLHRGHVRLDIIYRSLGARGRAIIDLIGTVFFLFPFIFVLGIVSLPHILLSWEVLEGSAEVAGLPTLFLFKSCILGFVILLGLQGFAALLQTVGFLAGQLPVYGGDLDQSRRSTI